MSRMNPNTLATLPIARDLLGPGWIVKAGQRLSAGAAASRPHPGHTNPSAIRPWTLITRETSPIRRDGLIPEMESREHVYAGTSFQREYVTNCPANAVAYKFSASGLGGLIAPPI